MALIDRDGIVPIDPGSPFDFGEYGRIVPYFSFSQDAALELRADITFMNKDLPGAEPPLFYLRRTT